ncbi:MAG: serine/threonine protein kinase [Phormidium tanganyikae FI6-MK23]|jgi:serine/threonine-protein kinase|nr:serine/threonine protein kinase [Phormidium tanganyikae FI6-MK23]
MIGKILAGHFKITQALSSGGFGQTFLAEDTHIPGHPVCVVKQLKPLNTSPQALSLAQRLFEQEARILTQLGKECDQIPNLQAYFTEENEFYLVQEYVEGHTLDVEMLPGTQWTEAKVLELLQGVLPILKFIHSKGVIHRDIKPANLIRRQRDGKLVLIDFGAIKAVQEQVSAELDPTVATGTRIGTQGYAPTEQGRGKPRSNSDLYALGMVAIQALTGRSPSQLDEDSQTGEIVWEHLSSASPGLKVVLNRMTRYHFKDRYQSAEEALQAVQQLSQPAATVAATDFIPTPMPAQTVAEYTPIPVAKETEVILPQPPQPIPVPPTPTSRPVSQPVSDRGNIAWLIGVFAAFGVISVGAAVFIASMQGNRSPNNLAVTTPATTQGSLAQAKAAAETGDLGKAIELAKSITGSEETEAQQLISNWQPQWDDQQKTFQKAREAYDAGRWQEAKDLAFAIPHNSYWDGQKELERIAVNSDKKLVTERKTSEKKEESPQTPGNSSSEAQIQDLQQGLIILDALITQKEQELMHCEGAAPAPGVCDQIKEVLVATRDKSARVKQEIEILRNKRR